MFISYLHSAWAFSMFAIKPDNWMRTCAVTARCAVAAAFAVAFALMNSATAVTISTDTIIGPGSSFDGQFIEVVDGVDGPTTVRVIEGGSIRGFNAFESNHVILDGGINTFISVVADQAQFTMNAGSFGCFADACSVISIGGTLAAIDQGQLHFFGGVAGGPSTPEGIALLDNSIANVYGRNLSIVGPDQGLTVSGIYGNGTQVSLSFEAEFGRSQVTLHEIPEPSTCALLLVCASLLRSSHRNRQEK